MKRLYELMCTPDGDGGAGGGGTAGGAAGAGGSQASGDAGASGGGKSLIPAAGGSAGSGAGANGGQGGDAGAGAGGQAGGGGNPAGSGTAKAWFDGLYDTTGKIDPTKLEGLPADLKPYGETFKKYPTVEALMRGHANLAQLAGKKGLQPLPPGSPPEAIAERNALMRTLNNVPEKPEGYGIKKPDGVPDAEWNNDYVSGMAAVMHKHNLSPEAVKDLLAEDQKHATGLRSKRQADVEAYTASEANALKEAFGDQYETEINNAARVARTLGLDPQDASVFGNSKTVIAFAKMAKMVESDKLVTGDGPAGGFGKGDLEKARDVVHNKDNPMHKAYHDESDPRHTEVFSHVQTLYKNASRQKQK
jgi:hypothetical protein